MNKVLLVLLAGLTAGSLFANGTPEAEKVEKDVTIVIGLKTLSQTDKDRVWPWATVQGVYDATGINLDLKPFTDETINVWLASGDLPDILNIDKAFYGQMISAGQVIALDDLIKKRKATNLTNAWPLRTEFSRRFMSNDTGKLYWLPTLAGTVGWERRYGGAGYFARWDLYKDLGLPKIQNNDESILDFTERMLKLYPQTPDGKKTYGFGHFNDWGLWSWKTLHATKDGYFPVVVDGYNAKVTDSQLYSEWLDVANSPYWSSMAFYNKANRRGILDPDSLTMNMDAFRAKCAGFQYVAGYADWFVKAPTTRPDAAIFAIPMDGVTIDIGKTTLVGGGTALGVTNKAKRPDKAVDLMNWLFSTDATRLFGGGIKGVHWDYDAKGVPRMTARYFEMNKDPDLMGKQGIWNYSLLGNCGSHLATMHTDGYVAGIVNSPEVWVARNAPAHTDFAQTYGFATQGEVWRDLYKQGKINAHFNFKMDIIQALPTAPDDIRRIDTRLLDIATRAIPDLVLAKDDAAYRAAQQKALADLKAAGAETAWKWWKAEWDKAKAFVDSVLGK